MCLDLPVSSELSRGEEILKPFGLPPGSQNHACIVYFKMPIILLIDLFDLLARFVAPAGLVCNQMLSL